MSTRKFQLTVALLIVLSMLLAACGATPEPQVVEKVVTQVVQETVMVAGTPQVVEKVVTEQVVVERDRRR